MSFNSCAPFSVGFPSEWYLCPSPTVRRPTTAVGCRRDCYLGLVCFYTLAIVDLKLEMGQTGTDGV